MMSCRNGIAFSTSGVVVTSAAAAYGVRPDDTILPINAGERCVCTLKPPTDLAWR